VPATKSLKLASGQLKSGVNSTGPIGIRPDHSLDGHVAVNVTELKGTNAKLQLDLLWGHDGEQFVPADPPDYIELTEATGVVKHFTFKAPYFLLHERVTGTRASVTRDIHIQYS
jgi:hypothetical protein